MPGEGIPGRGLAVIIMCTCGRVKIAASTVWATTQPEICWAVPVDPDPSQPSAITHHYCPECDEKLKEEVDKLKVN